MNNITNKSLAIVREKKSGFLWVFFAIALLLIAIPMILYGLGRASYNGIIWCKERDERHIKKLIRKNAKIQTKVDKQRLEKELLDNQNKLENE